ncbi:hypothetical protein D3C71_1551680 [compost metagenome]
MHGLAEQTTTQTHLQALQVGHGLDLFAIPATHLRAGIACAAALDVVVGIESVHELAAVAVLHPRVHLTGREAKRHCTTKGKNRIFSGEVIRRGLRHLDGFVLERVHHAKCGHQFTTCMHRHFKFATRKGLDGFGEHLGATENRVERLGETRRQTPAHRGLRMRCGRDASGQYASNSGMLDDGTTIHVMFSEIGDAGPRQRAAVNKPALFT